MHIKYIEPLRKLFMIIATLFKGFCMHYYIIRREILPVVIII